MVFLTTLLMKNIIDTSTRVDLGFQSRIINVLRVLLPVAVAGKLVLDKDMLHQPVRGQT